MASLNEKKRFAEFRREFLKVAGGAILLSPLVTLLGRHRRGYSIENRKRKAILVDITKCIGCRSCNIGCKLWNNLPYDNDKGFDGLSKNTYTIIKPFPQYRTYVKWACMHCENPPCLSVCPAAAIYKREDGVVWIHEDRCFGCKYCIVACPYGVRFYHEERKSVVKCTMCFDRIDAGKKPMCVQVCPVNALEFGDREKIVKLARERAKQVNGYVFGDEETYGNDVIYVSKVPFEELGFPSLEKRVPATEALSKILIEKGGLGLFGAAALAFFSFVFWRRSVLKEVMKKEIPR